MSASDVAANQNTGSDQRTENNQNKPQDQTAANNNDSNQINGKNIIGEKTATLFFSCWFLVVEREKNKAMR